MTFLVHSATGTDPVRFDSLSAADAYRSLLLWTTRRFAWITTV